jgi:thiamine-monophosphate kinase
MRSGSPEPSAIDIDSTTLHARLDRPEPRLDLGRALRGIATAAGDVSDGLAADLGHICTASHVAADMHAADVPLSVPIRALLAKEPDLIRLILAGGDDYELVFTASSDADDSVRAAARAVSCPVTRIGQIVAGQKVRVFGPGGSEIALDRLGFAHF